MTMTVECRAAGLDQLLHAGTGTLIGYRIIGFAAGPLALATGRRADTETAFQRLSQHNTLPRLRGELVLIFEDALLDPSVGDEVAALLDRSYDGSVYLSYHDMRGPFRRVKERAAYWAVLRLSARLGIISGRGIPGFGLSLERRARRVSRTEPALQMA